MTAGVAVVTGASRGLGRGMARSLARAGMTVYITGRDQGTLDQAAEECTRAGGKGIAVICDHCNDEQTRAVFARVAEESGRLDLLVNNAAAVHVEDLSGAAPFWEKGLRLAEMIDVGLRSNYVATYHAAPLLIKTGGALVAHISFYGAVSYFHGPAYGAAKAGTDKLAYDMAHDFAPHDVACVSLWPGFIRTEMIAGVPEEYLPPEMRASLPLFESPDFSGLVLERLWRDPGRMAFSGRTLIGAHLGERYGVRDLDGKQPRSFEERFGSPDDRFLVPDSEWPA